MFKISEKTISKKRRETIFIFIICIFGGIVTYKFEEGSFLWAIAIVILFIPYQAYKDIKHMKSLSLTILQEGICIDDGTVRQIVLYDRINRIKIKDKNSKIEQLLIVSDENKEEDLSVFEHVEEINLELKKYLKEELWEKK